MFYAALYGAVVAAGVVAIGAVLLRRLVRERRRRSFTLDLENHYGRWGGPPMDHP